MESLEDLSKLEGRGRCLEEELRVEMLVESLI